MDYQKFFLVFTLILCFVNLVILLVLLAKKNSKDSNDELLKRTDILIKMNEQNERRNAGEFERSRREQLMFQQDIRNEIGTNIKDMRAELSTNIKDMRTEMSNQLERQNRVLSASVERMQDSNEKKLEQMRITVDEKLNETLTNRLNSSFKTVSEQLESVYKSLGEMKELSTGVTDNVSTLNRVLTNVKARGTWAEVQLSNILDQTIPNMYVRNYSSNPNSRERVEFAVKIPSNDGSEPAYLPIDSKFPMEDYVRLCSAYDSADPAAVAAAKKALEQSVLSAARLITKYIDVPNTTPFAIMYLATEGLYSEIASSRSGLPEKLQNELNIMIAGPTTITALLNSLSMGFKAVAINEKANEIRKVLGAAKTQYDKFGIVLDKARKKIAEAGNTLEEAQDRNRIIQSKLKSVELLDEAESSDILGITEGLT